MIPTRKEVIQVKRAIAWALFDTRPGDLMLALFERLTGLTVVEVGEIDGEKVRATKLGLDRARVS
jgi:hypothetical protein